MPSKKEIILASILGGVGSGANEYLTEGNKQREYALKKLEVEKPPSEIESLKYVYPNWDKDTSDAAKMSPAEQQKALLGYRSAGSGFDYEMPKSGGGPVKEPVQDRSQTEIEAFTAASRREEARARAGKPSDPTDSAIVNKYKGKKSGGWN